MWVRNLLIICSEISIIIKTKYFKSKYQKIRASIKDFCQ